MWTAIAYGTAWVSTSLAVCVGLYYTHNSLCLLALIVPALLRLKVNIDKE